MSSTSPTASTTMPEATERTPEELEELARWLGSFGVYDSPKRRAMELLRQRARDLRAQSKSPSVGAQK